MLSVHVNQTREYLRKMSADLLILGFDLVDVFGVPVHDERLNNLQEVQSDWEHIDAQIVNIDVEAITLI